MAAKIEILNKGCFDEVRIHIHFKNLSTDDLPEISSFICHINERKSTILMHVICNAMSDWITSKIRDSIFCDILLEVV